MPKPPMLIDPIPTDDYQPGHPPLHDMPVTLRQRMNWSDVDAAQVGYTARQLALALDVIEIWWEQVIGHSWRDLREMGMGSPSVASTIEFFYPVKPGERTDSRIFVDKLGRSSIQLRVEGHNMSGVHCFTASQTGVLVQGVPEAPKSTPFPDDWRRRIENYQRECELAAQGVRSKREIIDFWFGPPGAIERGRHRPIWYSKDAAVTPDEFDSLITERFLLSHEAAAAGDLDHWMDSPTGAVALLILLDQFPRNMFRRDPRAFATDAKALALAELAVSKGYHEAVEPVVASFLLLPFEHSEILDIQEQSLTLWRDLQDRVADRDVYSYAEHHHEIIDRFGRFPHRNDVMERISTPEELVYIEDPVNRFGQ